LVLTTRCVTVAVILCVPPTSFTPFGEIEMLAEHTSKLKRWKSTRTEVSDWLWRVSAIPVEKQGTVVRKRRVRSTPPSKEVEAG